MMKRKVLSAAILAVMGVGSANAVNLSQTGSGEVAIVPYYSVKSGNETLLSIVNTTNEFKAVKIRFREGFNTADVYDFNLYLSPEDVWTTMVTVTDEGGAMLKLSADTSCTLPDLRTVSTEFLDWDYRSDEGPNTIERTAEGYIEVIEMGIALWDNVNGWGAWDNNIAALNQTDGVNDADHASLGVPNSCATLGNTWINQNDWTIDVGQPTGGLVVEAALINVQDGQEIGIPVTHLEAFFADPRPGQWGRLHTDPGATTPSLAQAYPYVSVVYDNAGPLQSPREIVTNWPTGIDAVSAVLMTQSIVNQYTVNPAVDATTDWVITFPTKRSYVVDANDKQNSGSDTNDRAEYFNGGTPGQGTPVLFRNEFDGSAQDINDTPRARSCEAVNASHWDREELTISSGLIPSPAPPDAQFTLCYEVNVLGFDSLDGPLGSESIPGTEGSSVMRSLEQELDVAFSSGWARFSFDSGNQRLYSTMQDRANNPVDGINNRAWGSIDADVANIDGTFFGLPAIGFKATRYGNANVGVGAAYSASAPHTYERNIVLGAPGAVTRSMQTGTGVSVAEQPGNAFYTLFDIYQSGM